MTDALTQRIHSRQLSSLDAENLVQQFGDEASQVVASEERLLKWLAEQYGLTFSDLEEVEIDRQLLGLFPARLLLKEEVLPLSRADGTVKVATSRLYDTQALDSLRLTSSLHVQAVLAPSEPLRNAIRKRLGVGADTLDTLKDDAAFQVVDEAQREDTDLDKAAEDASIIRFVNQVLSDAIDLRATDIHLEPFEDELRIRYRVDGVLQEVTVPSEIKRFQPAIVSRIKILSHLNIAEKRLPQDGRIKLRVQESEVDVRVSIIPMLHGEAVVMRLLRQDASVLQLPQLGMASEDLDAFRKVLALPHGIFLATGPTGSGKTTTLYTALNAINDAVRKIVTIEDPIEYQIKGINQIQVSDKTGLSFARGLRSILRHDPDVVLVGEIRDEETARIAVQASLTGHLVFSTLHTNDAPGAVTRLIDMGVEPYLVASSLEGVLAQRLVRVLCTQCKAKESAERSELLRRQWKALNDVPLFRPVGCKACRMTGYHGRRALFEMMTMNRSLRQLVLKGAASGDVREGARQEGLRTLSEDGARLIREGVTSPAEVLRVSKDEYLNVE